MSEKIRLFSSFSTFETPTERKFSLFPTMFVYIYIKWIRFDANSIVIQASKIRRPICVFYYIVHRAPGYSVQYAEIDILNPCSNSAEQTNIHRCLQQATCINSTHTYQFNPHVSIPRVSIPRVSKVHIYQLGNIHKASIIIINLTSYCHSHNNWGTVSGFSTVSQ